MVLLLLLINSRKIRQAQCPLNVYKSLGPDDIPPIILKICVPLLRHSFCFPLGFPVPKRGDSNDPNDYPPIALTLLISKIFEAIISDKLLSFPEREGLLSGSQ